MALIVWRTTFEAPTGDSADRLIYSWGLRGDEPDQAAMEAIRLSVEASWTQPLVDAGNLPLTQRLQAGYRMIFHEAFLATGGPAIAVIDADNTIDTVGTGGAAPGEVQVCVSRLVNTPRGFNPVGRIYYGPVAHQAINAIRPSAAVMDTFVTHAADLHDRFIFAGYQPEVIAKQGTALAAGKPIAAYRVDGLWDTQRRRGVEQALPGSAQEIVV